MKQHEQNSPCWALGLIKHKKKGCQSLGKQFVVCVDEGNRPVVVQQGSGLLALGQQGNEPHAHGSPAKAFCNSDVPKLTIQLIRQAVFSGVQSVRHK